MKKFKTYLYIGLSFAILGLAGCKKASFDDNYYNPEAAVEADIPRLYSGLLYNQERSNANIFFPRYWNMYVFLMPMPGTYSQTFGYTASLGRYEQKSAYTQQRWEYFYTAPLASFVEMKRLFEELTDEVEKEQYEIFLETGKIVLYDHAAQMVDMWGDIPFSEAGKIISSVGTIENAKYDDQKELYYSFIDDLKKISDYLNGLSITGSFENTFKKADIINQGSIEKWKIYANSLRLRLAMRISEVDENKAKHVAEEILNNPSQYPVVSSIANSIKIDARGNELRSVIGVDGIKGTFESPGFNYAPGYIVNELMVPSKDPRLEVLFSKNAKNEYLGLDPNLPTNTQDDQINNNLISRVDSATFSRNDKFPGIIITPAEIYFLKAEANERWGIGSDAKAEYETAIKQSIDFWYYVNALNDNADGTTYEPVPSPPSEVIADFLNNPIIKYEGSKEQKLEKIGTQNWANFTVIQAQHAWAEYRRTGYPKLIFSEDASSSVGKKPPYRLLYPENERTYNSQNYQQVKDKDRPDIKVFWHTK